MRKYSFSEALKYHGQVAEPEVMWMSTLQAQLAVTQISGVTSFLDVVPSHGRVMQPLSQVFEKTWQKMIKDFGII